MLLFSISPRNYEGYIECFESRLDESTDVADAFLNLVFARNSMVTAYRGLCEDLDGWFNDHIMQTHMNQTLIHSSASNSYLFCFLLHLSVPLLLAD